MPNNRIAFITGGTSGIGKGIALRFLAEDFKVYAVGHGKEHADELAKEAGKSATLTVMVGDICDAAFLKKCHDTIEKTDGHLDTLVNAAGIISSDDGGIKETLASWKKVIDTNLTGAFTVSQQMYNLLKKGHSASIINISSVYGMLHSFDPGALSYCVSKSGMDAMTKLLAKQLGADKIRVNSINPGYVTDTNILRGTDQSGLKEFKKMMLEKHHPIGRLGVSADIANAALFLASEEASWITGAILSVDGGFSTT